ncbi:G-protein alpha subunit [Phellopilus nigrolimitatus]|nr:G-protein alpha subunit [Phellopilus nigrolimitatus]
MKIIHQDWHTRHELMLYRMAVYRNLLESVQMIMLAIRKLSVDLCFPRTAYPIISRIMDRSSEFNLMDSASSFFSEVARFGHADYVPTRRTCCARAHQKSIGFVETRFNIGELSIHMFDVGGQHSERNNWIHVA